MRFSRDLPQARRYYFPGHYSYALFECLTPTGFQVVAIHGLGPLKQYEFERFAYQGQIDRADFLDGRTPREPDDVRLRLAGKGFRKLEPKHLLGALTGLHDSRDINLGLVPARSTGTYDRFRRIFNNILRLAHLKQNGSSSSCWRSTKAS